MTTTVQGDININKIFYIYILHIFETFFPVHRWMQQKDMSTTKTVGKLLLMLYALLDT